MLKTPPGKGREKYKPPPPLDERPRKSSAPPADFPEIKSQRDFDRVLRGLLAVPASVKPVRHQTKKKRKRRA